MKTKSLLIKLSKFFPKKIAEKTDYVGLMCGNLPENVNKILLCLDYDEFVYKYVENFKPDIVITHHPFIYGSLNKVLKEDENKRILYEKMLKVNIPVYSFHTNFDEGKNGMNDALATALDLKDIVPLTTFPMARGGRLPIAMTYDELAKYVMNKLNVPYCLKLNYGKKEISKIAIVGGGGWFAYKNAMLEKYDCFISGDIPHHGRREILLDKFNYIDIPHEVERIFMKQMKKVLLNINANLNILTIDHEKEPEILFK